VATISTILNVTRTYAGVSSAAGMRRAVAIARDYATRRQAFGDKLSRKPLHVATLAAMELDARAAAVLTFYVVRLLGRSEVNKATREESTMLRLLTPLLKVRRAGSKRSLGDRRANCEGASWLGPPLAAAVHGQAGRGQLCRGHGVHGRPRTCPARRAGAFLVG